MQNGWMDAVHHPENNQAAHKAEQLMDALTRTAVFVNGREDGSLSRSMGLHTIVILHKW